MKQHIKKLADDLHKALDDQNFESFIAQQILSNKNDEDGPLFSITNRDTSIDIWIKGHQYVMVKSILPGSSNTRKGFTKKFKKVDELLNEIRICIIEFLNVHKD